MLRTIESVKPEGIHREIVIAPAGCGKTEQLLNAVAEAININHLPSNKILCVTTTSQAAHDLERKILDRFRGKEQLIIPENLPRTISIFSLCADCIKVVDLKSQRIFLPIDLDTQTKDFIKKEIGLNEFNKNIIDTWKRYGKKEEISLSQVIREASHIREYKKSNESNSCIEDVKDERNLSAETPTWDGKASTRDEKLLFFARKYLETLERCNANQQRFWYTDTYEIFLITDGLLDKSKGLDVWPFIKDLIQSVSAESLSNIPSYDLIFVDDVQEHSSFNLNLITKFLSKTGRIIYFGDPQLAISSYAGSKVNSIYRLAKKCDHITSMSINYRSPSYIVDFLNHYYCNRLESNTLSKGTGNYLLKYNSKRTKETFIPDYAMVAFYSEVIKPNKIKPKDLNIAPSDLNDIDTYDECLIHIKTAPMVYKGDELILNWKEDMSMRPSSLMDIKFHENGEPYRMEINHALHLIDTFAKDTASRNRETNALLLRDQWLADYVRNYIKSKNHYYVIDSSGLEHTYFLRFISALFLLCQHPWHYSAWEELLPFILGSEGKTDKKYIIDTLKRCHLNPVCLMEGSTQPLDTRIAQEAQNREQNYAIVDFKQNQEDGKWEVFMERKGTAPSSQTVDRRTGDAIAEYCSGVDIITSSYDFFISSGIDDSTISIYRLFNQFRQKNPNHRIIPLNDVPYWPEFNTAEEKELYEKKSLKDKIQHMASNPQTSTPLPNSHAFHRLKDRLQNMLGPVFNELVSSWMEAAEKEGNNHYDWLRNVAFRLMVQQKLLSKHQKGHMDAVREILMTRLKKTKEQLPSIPSQDLNRYVSVYRMEMRHISARDIVMKTHLFKPVVFVMTIQQSKGQSFDNVFLINSTSVTYPDKSISADRLYYAGLSRAQKRIIISFCDSLFYSGHKWHLNIRRLRNFNKNSQSENADMFVDEIISTDQQDRYIERDNLLELECTDTEGIKDELGIAPHEDASSLLDFLSTQQLIEASSFGDSDLFNNRH